jgi:hypothetical protein
MILAMIMAVQPAELPPAQAAPIGFDLARYRPSEPVGAGCTGGANGTEIVVCGRRAPGTYPLEEMEARFREKPLRAEIGIAPNAALRAYGEQVDLGQGLVSKRAMIGMKLRF